MKKSYDLNPFKQAFDTMPRHSSQVEAWWASNRRLVGEALGISKRIHDAAVAGEAKVLVEIDLPMREIGDE